MLIPRLAAALAFLAAAAAAFAQFEPAAHTSPFNRLPADVFEVTPPTASVRGEPGAMTVRSQECRTLPLADVRRRIVDVAVQEWAFFGFSIRDETALPRIDSASRRTLGGDARSRRRFFPRLDPEEAARTATSVAGYWAATPQATMMVARQNDSWTGSDSPRRADPWSAAFVSWVMCESGLGGAGRFQRAIAHHVYIDQAIRARDGSAPQAAFVAYDAGEIPITPGDLLCAGRRPVYRSLAQRRRQMGEGARTHCDIVVKVDEAAGRIYGIGGNVGRAVSLKLLRAEPGAHGHLQVNPRDEDRPVFAHLTLRAEPIEADALDTSPTIKALACATGFTVPPRMISLVRGAAVDPPARRC